MKVLFIANFSAIEPLGLLYLMGSIKSLGHSGKILMIKDYNFSEAEKFIKSLWPDILGFIRRTFFVNYLLIDWLI